ncbi:hypothetical protein I3842_05G196900 [Carya illinoinensis]|uniref:Uncharacterized protein n=1 Tax=Carya illinoinensis TaxID=32201 RepID=A0A922F2V8_CARIL|nr:hypothetical protein I3842_05G196900 [Carya illinoinensis]
MAFFNAFIKPTPCGPTLEVESFPSFEKSLPSEDPIPLTVVSEAPTSLTDSRLIDREEASPSSSFVVELSDDHVSIPLPSLNHSSKPSIGSYLASDEMVLLSPPMGELNFP